MRIVLPIFVFLVLGFSVPVSAATITSAASGQWSDSATWDGAVPGEDDEVTILEGHTVVYDLYNSAVDAQDPADQADGMISPIMVEGTLSFAIDQDTAMVVDEFMVHDGVLQIGTEVDPLPGEYTARIHLSGLTEELMVQNGTLDIHGASTLRTWTRLRSTANADKSTIRLKKKVDWPVGSQIVIASTSYNPEEAEVRTITDVGPKGKKITLDSPLEFRHYGEGKQFAEVGLLTHNIRVTGDGESEPYDAGHTMATGDSVMRISHAHLIIWAPMEH